MWIAMALVANAAVPAKEPPREIEVGAGLFFNAGGVFMTQPADNKDGKPGLPYNGFAGFSPGAGLQLEGRYKGIVGLEVDVTRWAQNAESEFTIEGISYPWFIRQGAWQIPVLLKLTAPVGIVRPNLFVGPEFVLVGNTTVEEPVGWPAAVDLTAGTPNYMLWTFGLGFETAVPIEGVDLRIPFAIRLSANPGIPKSAFDRATYQVDGAPWDGTTSGGTLQRIDYISEWQYQAAVTLGVSYWFL